MQLKKHIPNSITCGNLLCGCFGIVASFDNRLDFAFYFVMLAAVLDFFDGFAARLLKVSSPIGKDLDSLADMVTFGVLPGFIMFRMIAFSGMVLGNEVSPLFKLIAFIIPVFSALRLAKFNNDPRQTDGFIGLATPANTILISSLSYVLFGAFRPQLGSGWEYILPSSTPMKGMQFMNHPYYLGILAVAMSLLLVSEIPLFALKFKNFGWSDNQIRYIFLIIAAVLLILFQVTALPFIILLYILLSIIYNFTIKKKDIHS
ncbi:MAG TPA: CDP-alcohol phosphatidyltransferase family protein [Bacteroidia bacterium]|jgi:CDP-diacylglycerol--serine O-phosphatidyltransferase|nr:CDP-alcohol phosphatidyltransferase family protein [Bacteroidia bacterium]